MTTMQPSTIPMEETPSGMTDGENIGLAFQALVEDELWTPEDVGGMKNRTVVKVTTIA